MILLSMVLVGLVTHAPCVTAAGVSSPVVVASCADVDRIVRGYSRRNVDRVDITSDGTWTEAVIPAVGADGPQAFKVREQDIELLLWCWEAAYRADTLAFEYNQKKCRVRSLTCSR